MFVYALARGVNQGYLDPSYMVVARRGFARILSQFVTVQDGLVNLNWICSVAGLGGKDQRDGSFAYYISEPISNNDPKGVGPFILASLEIEAIAVGDSAAR